MFSFLVALTLYMSFAPERPAATLSQYLPRTRAFLPLSAAAADQPAATFAPRKKDSLRLGVETASRSAFVMDWRTGTPLLEKDADMPRPIASITKLMTALVVLDEGVGMDRVVEVLPSDARPGGIPYVIPGERIRVRDLFNVSLIASGNGATVALARSTGLSMEEFAARMNAMAFAIGMRNSFFVEPTGLDPSNVASARDVALLLKAALEKGDIKDAVLRKDYEFTAETGLDHKIRSTDELLDSRLSQPPYGLLGGKTGFLYEAGYCFAAAARNASGDKVVAVALGAPDRESRFRDVKDLIYWAFDAYGWPYAPIE